METIEWSEGGSSGRVRAAVNAGETFVVRLPRWMSALIPDMALGAALTPLEASLLVAIASLALFGGLAVYALGKGYTVRRRTPDGEEWVFEPPASAPSS